MIIAATSDLHTPAYYELFLKSLDMLQTSPDLFLLAGDIVERGTLEEEIKNFEKVSNALFGKISCPIIAVFGNTEFDQYREEIKSKFKNIRFLDDEGIIINVKGTTISIFGTTGALDEPTRWQKIHRPEIEKIYKERYILAENFFKRTQGFKILLSHYAPTYKTLEGENPFIYKNLGSRYWENLMIKKYIDLAIHGHAHNGTRFAWVNSTPVFNVALPLNKSIVLIDTEKIKPGLTQFL